MKNLEYYVGLQSGQEISYNQTNIVALYKDPFIKHLYSTTVSIQLSFKS